VGFDESFRNRKPESDAAMIVATRLPEIIEQVINVR
jgi:hypothetical protein